MTAVATACAATLRRLNAQEAARSREALADVLVDCVEGARR